MEYPFVRIALPVPLRRYFDYSLPESLQASAQLGVRVEVQFGRQSLVGIIVDLLPETDVPADKIKAVSTLIDKRPLLPLHIVKMKMWLCQYYVCFPGDVFINLLPKRLKSGESAELLASNYYRLIGKGKNITKTAIKQRQAYDYLLSHSPCSELELKKQGISSTILKRLIELNELAVFQQKALDEQPNVLVHHAQYSLNDEQLTVISEVDKKLTEFSPCLLEGVTGSGKTEVYLQLIEKVIKLGKQALILVPEIGLTPQTLARFESRFETDIVVLHSDLNDTQRHNAWLKAQRGIARIIIGTRSAVLVPMPDLGMIILDEEHDLSYKQQDGLRYHARDIAVKRAHLEKVPVILGSATPSLETLNNAQEGRYLHLRLLKRATAQAPPVPMIIDTKDQPLQSGLAIRVVELIEKKLKNNEQVLIFLNRRGFSPALLCHECGWLCQCKRCDNHYTYHKTMGHLQCHHCGDICAVPHQCQDCGSTQIVDWGVGTEKLEEWLNQRFPDASAIRIDRDSVRRKGELEKRLKEINEGKHQILVGTQMLAKGHHFPHLTLTIIVNVDSGLYSADYRAVERLAQLIVQVSGRAGRDKKPGHVVLQTHNPDHELMQTLTKKGYPAIQRYLMRERKAMMLPPFQFWALLRIEAHNVDLVQRFCQYVYEVFSPYLEHHYSNVIGMPSMPAPQEKRAGRFRYLMVFESKLRAELNAAMQQLCILLEERSGLSQVRWSLDIDPQEIN